MLLQLVKSKIHRAEVTDCSLNYEGSLAIDSDLMEQADLRPYEKILVGNIANGERFETYVIPASAGSLKFSLNGGTAHLGKIGDLLTIMAFAWMDEAEASQWKPKVIVLGDHNQKIIRKSTK